MITGWTILHIPRRYEREAMALSNAERLGVPSRIVRFWDAKDNADFENADAVWNAAVADGFPEFNRCRGLPDDRIGRYCQIWNICRYLRDLSNKNVIEMFIHDGMMIGCLGVGSEYYIGFQWLCTAVKEANQYALNRGTDFKMLILGHNFDRVPVELIHPTSIISHGIRSNANSIRIYSSVGAAHVLNRILSDEHCYCNSTSDHVFFEKEKTSDNVLWELKGAFTITISNAFDMPSDLLGSDREGWPQHQGIYEKLFKDVR